MENMNYQVTMLYIATFGRAPDSGGLEYWVNQSGLDIEEIALSFFDQDETQQLYPPNTFTDTFISSVYQNLFNRKPDSGGLEYWRDELDSGKISKSHFILAVTNGALGDDAVLLENKTEVGLAFVNDGLDDVELAHSVIDKVTIKSDSVTSTINLIDDIANGSLTSEAFAKYSYNNNDLSNLSNFDTYGVAQLDSSYRWGNSIEKITYSFNTTLPDEYSDKDSQNWEELNASQQNAVHEIMDGLSNLLGISFMETSTDNGMIRFNVIDMDSNIAGYAYYPGDYNNRDGDVFLSQIFNTDDYYLDLSPGTIGFDTIAHEIGHTLGLKHPFDGYPTLPNDIDDTNHTIMSYTDKDNIVPVFTLKSNGLNVSYEAIAPQLYSLYDVSALQAIYGVNKTTNISNNIYTLKYTDYKIYTIWDAGGNDTIDLSQNSGHDIIDMHDGTLNSADYHTLDETVSLYQTEVGDSYYNSWIKDKIDDLYNSQELYEGKNNLSIATGVVIENLFAGNNSDIIKDNKVNNHISTQGGNDKIYLGSGGYDYIDGGYGFDTIQFEGLSKDVSVSLLENSHYLIVGDNFAADIIGVEQLYFTAEGKGFAPIDLVE